VKARDREGALAAFDEAIRRLGPNWALLDEVARFLVYKARDYPRGLEMATLARELNPASPGLWNTYGDALYYLGRLPEARAALGEALRRCPESPRALLSLAYLDVAERRYADALRTVAEGLRCDGAGSYRKALMGRQRAALDALSQRHDRRRNARAARSVPCVSDGGDPPASDPA
jgi:predicted Zn-dependent protease